MKRVTMTYEVGNPGNRHTNVAELDRLMISQSFHLDNWISNGNIIIIIKNLH
jgi:hypothetical protein